MRPVFRGMCKLESLLDCTLTLEDLAMANDYIDVHNENEHRMIEAMREE